jgi:ATP-dependent Clp protease ATP-binding subunit ClpB
MPPAPPPPPESGEISAEELQRLRESVHCDGAPPDDIRRWESYLLGLEQHLKKNLRGQSAALEALCRAICRAEVVGVRKKGKPKASFFCAGPTGVGKTESAKLIAGYLFGSTKSWRDGGNFAVWDMGEFAEQGSIAQMLGRNRDEQGDLGDAIDALCARGGGIILFDEIEKAHPTVALMMLGLLDEARVTMKNGKVKNVSNCYIICTSNVGAAKASKLRKCPVATVTKAIVAAAQKHFRPEFMARFSAMIVFMRLTRDVQVEICRDYMPALLSKVANYRGFRSLAVDEDALVLLAAKSYDQTAGARFVMSVLDREVGDAVLEWLPKQVTPHPALRLTVDPVSKRIVIIEVGRTAAPR